MCRYCTKDLSSSHLETTPPPQKKKTHTHTHIYIYIYEELISNQLLLFFYIQTTATEK